MSILSQDLKLSVRQLWRRPVFTLTAVLTLAIGMGVNAVAFTVVNGVLFKRSAMSAADDVGRIVTTPGGDESGYASLAEYQRFADATRGALDLAAEGRLSMAWRYEGTTQTAWVLFVSSNYFSMVDARAIAGHVGVARAADGVPSAVIGERFWQRTLKKASLSGLTLRLNNTDVRVAGVLPESFRGPAGLYSPDVWLPLDDLVLFSTSPALQNRDHRWIFVFGRLRPGVGVPEVQGRVDAAVAAMAHDWPDSHRQRGDLVSDVLRSSARLLFPGLITGTLVAAAVARLVQAAFVGVNVLNPLTYLAVALLECVIVAAACISPALGASRVDPLVALRSE